MAIKERSALLMTATVRNTKDLWTAIISTTARFVAVRQQSTDELTLAVTIHSRSGRLRLNIPPVPAQKRVFYYLTQASRSRKVQSMVLFLMQKGELHYSVTNSSSCQIFTKVSKQGLEPMQH